MDALPLSAFHAHALGALAEVAGPGLNFHLGTVLPPLLSAMDDDDKNSIMNPKNIGGQMDDTGSNFTQLGDIDDDPTDYIDFSDEIEYDMPNEMEEDIQNDLINSVSNVLLSTPTKNIDISIEVGMEFSERKDVIDWYKAFGMTKGFGIRARQTKKNYMKLTCAREGYPISKTNNVGEVCETKSRNTSSSRIGCKACFKASTNGDTNMWKIKYFDDNHNHGLVTPKSVPYIRSYRQMPGVARSLVEKFNDSGLPIGKVATILRGPDLLFDSRDCYNHMKNVSRKIYDVGDAQAVVRYCNRQQSMNPNFFYSIKYDDEDRLESFFCIDARSRHSYDLFGDFITFDMTYRTNKYALPFGPFVGVNNHLQSILFGCALLKDETEDTFVWLFEEWLRAMNGKHPGAIITDQLNLQDKRSCHVYQDHGSFKKEFNDCIYKSNSIQEFEDKWHRLIVEYRLIGNEWMHSLYSIRSSWIPIFNRSTFFAGMHTTQRSESINAFFDDFVTSGTTLNEFVEKYNQAVDARYESLKKANFESMHKERRLQFNMLLEEHAAKVYTRAIYVKFVTELSHILSFSNDKLTTDGEWVSYRIPEHFILRRWHKEGNDVLSKEREMCLLNRDGLVHSLHLSSKCNRLIELAQRSDEAFQFIYDGLDSLALSAEKFSTYEESNGRDTNVQCLNSQLEDSSMINLKDPNISQTKGRKRICSGIEEASKQSNYAVIATNRLL
ncbi:protein FAR1-RELATED SEQUENCE 5-like [Gastrolobium bilobum]|uniref:protein FAR1-RELATED SEQUENCE 5-like n=1 Tax=Gastrolobium bilobum TaxID=150636 RepID=UPI002AB15CEB|nr:protein FAR1-RELATED SEQUENCE 5-like [Gastrolobium bilobum]